MQDYYFFLREGWIFSVQNILDNGVDVVLEILGEEIILHPRGGPRGTVTVGRFTPQDFGTPARLITMLIKTFEAENSQEELAKAFSAALNPYY